MATNGTNHPDGRFSGSEVALWPRPSQTSTPRTGRILMVRSSLDNTFPIYIIESNSDKTKQLQQQQHQQQRQQQQQQQQQPQRCTETKTTNDELVGFGNTQSPFQVDNEFKNN